MNPNELYMCDCIHLRACRRYSGIVAKESGQRIGRGCNKDCSAYTSGKSDFYVSVDEAVNYARSVGRMVERGNDPYDSACSSDLEGMTLSDIVGVGDE